WLEHLNYNAKQGFFSITFVAHPHSRWFIVSHVLRAQLTEVINLKTGVTFKRSTPVFHKLI
ncbi:hypothetical protein K2V56_11350, partial [Staphylococcus chromogenes]|uniref:hypothetical protein n=1 Tax=Staphylococcus chromogenes TaxID=46126 RepID=UPI001E4CA519